MCGCVPVRLIEPLLFSVYSRGYTRPLVYLHVRDLVDARVCASPGRYARLGREQKGEKERNWVNVISRTLSVPAIAI